MPSETRFEDAADIIQRTGFFAQPYTVLYYDYEDTTVFVTWLCQPARQVAPKELEDPSSTWQAGA